MAQNASVPAETDILCEHCGYGLNGLPTDGRCPECGELITDSTVQDGRVLPTWERPGRRIAGAFASTTGHVIFSPATFFRQLQTRVTDDRSKSFADLQQCITAVLLALTAVLHADAMNLYPKPPLEVGFSLIPIMLPLVILIVWFSLWSITRLASSLTRLEGAYWGYRLPAGVVRRALNFHSAQLLPVAIVALITVAGYWFLLRYDLISAATGVKYLIVISIEVLLAAGYLFRTYWIAMKNIMYANR